MVTTKPHTILFLAANPREHERLDLDEEARGIREALRGTMYRDQFNLETRPAARPGDLPNELRRKPTVVHFSGHGRGNGATEARAGGAVRRDTDDGLDALNGDGRQGLVLQGKDGRAQFVANAALKRTFAAGAASVKLVVLNACFSKELAGALTEHVDCVVGMGGSIDDKAARTFAIELYSALGDGESVAAAFEQGCARISLEGLPDSDLPQLKARDGVDPKRLVLAAAPPAVRGAGEASAAASGRADFARAPSSVVTPSALSRCQFGPLEYVKSLDELPESWECHPLQSAEHFQPRPEFLAVAEWLSRAKQGVFALIGLGGSGKTAIAEQLVRSLDERDTSRVASDIASRFVFSFYGPDATPDALFNSMGRWLSSGQQWASDADSVRHALTQLARAAHRSNRKLLLVIDGLEQVQQGETPTKRTGSLTDQRLSGFLDACAAGLLPGVCTLVTTRLPLADLEVLRRRYYTPRPLGSLSADVASNLLRALGLDTATDDELGLLVDDYAAHALTIHLVGNFIAHFHHGDVKAFRRMETAIDWRYRAASLEAGGSADATTAAIQREAEKLVRIAGFYFEELERSAPDALSLLKFIAVLHLPADAKLLAGLAPAKAPADRVRAPSAVEGVAARLRYLFGLGLLSRADDDTYVLHPGIRDSFRELTTEKQGLQKAIVGQLRVELEDRSSMPVLDDRRIELLRAYALHLLELSEDGSSNESSLQLAWSCVNGPAPDGLGGWAELVWGTASTASAVAQVCEALEVYAASAPGLTLPGHFRRIWSAALACQGQLEAATVMTRRALEDATQRGDEAHAELCRDDLAGRLKRCGRLRRSLSSEIGGSELGRSDRLLRDAETAACMADVPAAWAKLEQSLRLELQSNDPDDSFWGRELRLASALAALGALREATELALQGAESLRPLRNSGLTRASWAFGVAARTAIARGDLTTATAALTELAANSSRDLLESLSTRLLRIRTACHVDAQACPRDVLDAHRLELAGLLDEARGYGASTLHSDALLALGELELLVEEPRAAWLAASRALYGDAATPFTGDESTLFGPPAIELRLDDAETDDPRGEFFATSGAPALLAITHSFRRDRILEAEAILLQAKALLMSARIAGSALETQRTQRAARRLLERCVEVRSAFHVTPSIQEQDTVYAQARELLRALDGELVDRCALWSSPPATCRDGLRWAPVSPQGHPVATEHKGFRRYCYSLSYPASSRAYAERLARRLAAVVGDRRVAMDLPAAASLPVAIADLLCQRALACDSSVMLIVGSAKGDEVWSGYSATSLATLGAAVRCRAVYFRPDVSRFTVPDHVTELRVTRPLDDLLLQLAKKLASVRETEAGDNRAYYLRFKPSDGRSAFYFVLIERTKEPAFLKALEGSEGFNIEDHGYIVNSGYGEASPALKAEMKVLWNIKYNDDN